MKWIKPLKALEMREELLSQGLLELSGDIASGQSQYTVSLYPEGRRVGKRSITCHFLSIESNSARKSKLVVLSRIITKLLDDDSCRVKNHEDVISIEFRK